MEPSNYYLFALVALLALGCDTMRPVATNESDSIHRVGSEDVALHVEYEEEMHVFSSRVPRQLVGKAGTSENERFLVDYELRKVTQTYDRQGYLSRTVEYLADRSLGMPEEIYRSLGVNNLKPGSNHDPLHRITVSGSNVSMTTRSGRVLASRSVDPEAFRIDPDDLSLFLAAHADSTAGQTVRERLNQAGINIDSSANGSYSFATSRDGVKSQHVVSSRFGVPLKTVTYRSDGSPDLVERRWYQVVDNVPLLRITKIDRFALVGGEYVVAEQIQKTRTYTQIVGPANTSEVNQ